MEKLAKTGLSIIALLIAAFLSVCLIPIAHAFAEESDSALVAATMQEETAGDDVNAAPENESGESPDGAVDPEDSESSSGIESETAEHNFASTVAVSTIALLGTAGVVNAIRFK